MVEHLPQELKPLLQDMSWTQNKVGCSCDQVFHLTSPQQNYYLKIGKKNQDVTLLYEKDLSLERDVLVWLQGKLPVPEVVYYGVENNQEFLLITEVSGKMAQDSIWKEKEWVVSQLAKGLKMIHSLPIEGCPFHHSNDSLIQRAYQRTVQGLVDEENFDECRKGKSAEELYKELLAMKPREEDVVFTHGDYCLPNIILSSVVGVSGFIDWGRGGVSDRYRDLGIVARSIAHNIGEDYIVLFFRDYGLEYVDKQKVTFYQLLDEFF